MRLASTSEMHLGFGSAARILDLVGSRHEQRRERRRQLVERPVEERRDGRRETQIPAQRSERDRAYGGAIDTFVRRFERRIRGTAVGGDRGHGERGMRQRFRAGRMTLATRIGDNRRKTTCLMRRTSCRRERTAFAKSRAETGRLPARCNSLTASTPSPQATCTPSSARPNKVPGAASVGRGAAWARRIRNVSPAKPVSPPATD